MKLAIMQPYFLPYAGYFGLIAAADRFISFDTAQYIRHGWINRNRVLKPGEGWQYIIVPVKKHAKTERICRIEVAHEKEWDGRILRQLEHYKKRAPFYSQVRELLESCFARRFTFISEMNFFLLREVCAYLGLRFEAEEFSKMDLEIGEVDHPGAWALQISRAVGATEYLNPIGGAEIFSPSEFAHRGIALEFLRQHSPRYSQRRGGFEEGLSIVDVMMFNSPEAIREMLDEREIVDASTVFAGEP